VIGRPRTAVAGLPAYRPGKDAAQAEAEHGIINAIKLASNETPWGPVASVQQKVADAAGGTNRYADHRASVLRERLARWLGVDLDMVTAGCGSVGLLQQLYLTYVDPGDEVVYPWRSFEVYPVFTRLMGGTEVTVPLVGETFDLVAVAGAVTERTKMVLLANPNNPTGTAVPMTAVKALLESIADDVIVVLDEAYREFMSESLGDPIGDGLLAAHHNLVVLRTFSKAQGLAALRVGYAIGHPEVIGSIDKTLFPFAVNGLAQTAAIASIDAHAEVMERVEFIKGERARVVATLESAGWSIPTPEANFVYLSLGARTDEVFLDLEKKGVVTRPFAGEGLRVTIGSTEENDRFLRGLLGD
jgi:histidinol-phosphate aminotransferase